MSTQPYFIFVEQEKMRWKNTSLFFLCPMIIFFNLFLASHCQVIFSLGLMILQAMANSHQVVSPILIRNWKFSGLKGKKKFVLNYCMVSIGNHFSWAGQENYTWFCESHKIEVVSFPCMNDLTQSTKIAWKWFLGKCQTDWNKKHLFRKVFKVPDS